MRSNSVLLLMRSLFVVGLLLSSSSFSNDNFSGRCCCWAFSTATTRLHHHHDDHATSSSNSRRRRRRRRRTNTRPFSSLTSRHNMFTGIVEDMGTVIDIQTKDDMTLWDGSVGKGTELTIGCSTSSDDSTTSKSSSVILDKDSAYLGCSICVNGVCLTATALDFDKQQFKVGLAPETLRCTYFDDPTQLHSGSKVNLERASEIGGRNSGHFVQGHVDCTGTIIDKWTDEDSLFFKVQVADVDKMPYIVPKGFIAIDGTSLTVVDVDPTENWFTFMLVAYTQQKIIIPSKAKGDKVNLEVDVLGKYSSNTLLTTIIPRLEALEAQVQSLQKQIDDMK